jgi:large subunit ribosomal protein L10
MKQKQRTQHSPKELRQMQVAQIKEELEKANSFILFSSQFITHQQFEELRAKLRNTDSILRFVKNSLFKVAAKELKLPESLYEEEVLTGPSGAVYINTEDFVSALKALDELFGSEKEKVQVKIGFIDKEVYNKSQVMQFAKIPSVDELRAKLVGMLQSPVYGLHNALSYNIGALVRTLKSVAEKQS